MRVCSFCHRCYDDAVLACVEEDHPALSELRNGTCDIVEGYRLELFCGSDSYGELYHARQSSSGQSCLIRIHSAPADARPQFLREAKLAATFFHPNVVDIYEAGELPSGELFVVAEKPDGSTLRELLTAVGVPELLMSVDVARQIGEALHALHLRGITHRAVNPHNIILSNDVEGTPVARIQNIDLGGVGERSIISDKFAMDSAVDSLRYFAPEQFSDETTGTRTDVYSLGIVFYEMLSGAPPFDASKAAGLIEKHRHQAPPEIKIDNFDLRMLIAHSLLESLAKQPWMRQSSANVFARQLRHIEQLATHSSTPPPAVAALPPMKFATRAAAASMRYSDVASPQTTRSMKSSPVETSLAIAEPKIGSTAQKFESDAYDGSTGGTVVAAKGEETSEIITPPQFDEPAAGHPKKEMGVSAPSRSRLKVRRRRSHVTIAPLLTGTAVEVVRPAEAQPGPVQAAPVEDASTRFDEEEITLVRARNKPIAIQSKMSDDDVPSKVAVFEAPAREQSATVQNTFREAGAFKKDQFTIFVSDDKDPLADDPFPYRAARDTRFVPSFMGLAEAGKPTDDNSAKPVLPAAARFSFAPYLAATGVGILAALVVIFFVANFLVSDPLRSAESARSDAAKTMRLQTSYPQTDRSSSQGAETATAPLIVQASLENSDKPFVRADHSDVTAVGRTKLTREPDSPASETSRGTAPAKSARNNVPSTVPSGSIVQNPPVSSTLVITYDKQKARASAESESRRRLKTPSPKSDNDGFTRPRIVGDPKR